MAQRIRGNKFVRPKIGNREKHHGETWKAAQETGEKLVKYEETYGKMGETCSELPLGGFPSHLVSSFGVASYIAVFTRE